MPTRSIPGLISLSSSRFFSCMVSVWFTTPVMLPPGRASDSKKPRLTGTPAPAMTMGIFAALRRAASNAAAQLGNQLPNLTRHVRLQVRIGLADVDGLTLGQIVPAIMALLEPGGQQDLLCRWQRQGEGAVGFQALSLVHVLSSSSLGRFGWRPGCLVRFASAQTLQSLR